MNKIAILSLKKSFITAGMPSHPSIALQIPGPCAAAARTIPADHGVLCLSAAAQGDALTTTSGTAGWARFDFDLLSPHAW